MSFINPTNIVNASDLNRLISLISYNFTPNDSGGMEAVLGEQIDGIWAQVISLNGGSYVNQGQDKNYADFKVIFRYRPQVTENWIILYEGQYLKIKDLQPDTTNYKRYWIVYASTTIQQESWS